MSEGPVGSGHRKSESHARLRGVFNWLSNWGFAALVAASILVAGAIAVDAPVPTPVPNFALKAAAVYRIEIGAAAFLGLYLISMALVLALNNRGFSEIGMSGLKAQDLANRGQQRAIEEHEKALESVSAMVAGIEEFTEGELRGLNERVNEIEEETVQKPDR